MATPTQAQAANPNSTANGLTQQSLQERVTALLAIIATGQNPDGTASSTDTFYVSVAAPSGNATTDTANITAAQAALPVGGGIVQFQPGIYLINATQTITTRFTTWNGAGGGTTLRPVAPISGQMIDVQADLFTLQNMFLEPSSATYSLNPACDMIRVFGLVQSTTIQNVSCLYQNGWFLNAVPNGASTPFVITLHNVIAQNCLQGIHLASLGVSLTCYMTNVFMNHMQGGDGFFIDGAHDIIATNTSAVMDSGANAFNAWHIKGLSAGIYITNHDGGGGVSFTGTSYKIERDASLNRPSNVQFTGGIVSGQGLGASIDCDDFLMQGHAILTSTHDGIDLVGAGSNIVLQNVFVQNSGTAAANTYYDISVTNTTGTIILDNCFGTSTGTNVAANLNATANTIENNSFWSATTQRAGTRGPSLQLAANPIYTATSGQGHTWTTGANTTALLSQFGQLSVVNELYPGDEAGATQTSGGFKHTTAAAPSNANGNNNDWAIGDNGKLWFKTGGAWAARIGNPVTSGSLSTQVFSSGVGAQVSTTRETRVVVPYSSAASAGTLVVALSPDNVTYSTVATLATLAGAGTTNMITLDVPTAWYVKLTATTTTFGTATWY